VRVYSIFVSLFITIIILGFSSAQANLQVVLPEVNAVSGMPIDRLEDITIVRTIGDQSSGLFDILIMISVDNDFTDRNESLITVSSSALAACSDPSTPSSCDSTEAALLYQLLYPRSAGDFFDDPLLQQFDDNRRLSESVGAQLYFKASTVEGGVIPDLTTCPETSFIVIPPRAPKTRGRVNENEIGLAIQNCVLARLAIMTESL